MEWTFEALCCSVATGYDRVVVKKALRGLEDERVLQGDRPRKLGFNVRVVTIADGFPARQELLELLQACTAAWPTVGNKFAEAVNRLNPRTREQLRRRGLVPCECHPNGGHPPSMMARYIATRRRAIRCNE